MKDHNLDDIIAIHPPVFNDDIIWGCKSLSPEERLFLLAQERLEQRGEVTMVDLAKIQALTNLSSVDTKTVHDMLKSRKFIVDMQVDYSRLLQFS